MSAESAESVEVDLGDPRSYRFGPPYDYWAKLRETTPVAAVWSPAMAQRFWVVTGYQQVKDVFADSDRFTTRYGSFLGFGVDSPDPASGRALMNTDGERHSQLHAMMRPYFSPRWQADLADRCYAALGESLRPRLDGEAFDFFSESAWLAPMEAIGRMLPLPPEDREQLAKIGDTVQSANKATDRQRSKSTVPLTKAQSLAYFIQRLQAYRENPTDADGLLPVMAAAVDAGDLTSTDAAVNLHNTLAAGIETTKMTLAMAMVLLGRNPDQFAALRRSPELIRSAVEEIVRISSPSLYMIRVATRETEFHGVTIGAGDILALGVPAANRDPKVFTEPYRFDISRSPNPHIGFGHGPHYCIGAALGRIEISALLRFLVDEVEEVRLAGEARWVQSTSTHGFDHTPVRLIGRRRG